MIRGISRGVIEVGELHNRYFERAVLYIRPDVTPEEGRALLARGEACIEQITRDSFAPPPKQKKKMPGWMLSMLSALAGAVGMWLYLSMLGL